jgi:hypothetical protein
MGNRRWRRTWKVGCPPPDPRRRERLRHLSSSDRLRWTSPRCSSLPMALVTVWRDPWMVVGSAAFTGDVAARPGQDAATGTRASIWRTWRATIPTSSCSPTSHTGSPPRTGQNPFPQPGGAGRRTKPHLEMALLDHRQGPAAVATGCSPPRSHESAVQGSSALLSRQVAGGRRRRDRR